MATKKTTKKHAGTGHTCGECRLGRWRTNYECLDVNGQPFMKECEHGTWHEVGGVKLTLRGSKACEKYEARRAGY